MTSCRRLETSDWFADIRPYILSTDEVTHVSEYLPHDQNNVTITFCVLLLQLISFFLEKTFAGPREVEIFAFWSDPKHFPGF